MRRNYQKELEKQIALIQETGETPRLLLHSCCAPCSSYVLEYLSDYFYITVLYYNPNITEPEEYRRRIEEQKRLISQLPARNPIHFLEGRYSPEIFLQAARGMESLPEGGARCEMCYRLRLTETARLAKEGGYDCFATTLSISPLKKAEKLNEIGEQTAAELSGIYYLNSDFKKKGGYHRSIELSKIYDLYRQDYCGCIFSRMERDKRNAGKGERQAETLQNSAEKRNAETNLRNRKA